MISMKLVFTRRGLMQSANLTASPEGFLATAVALIKQVKKKERDDEQCSKTVTPLIEILLHCTWLIFYLLFHFI